MLRIASPIGLLSRYLACCSNSGPSMRCTGTVANSFAAGAATVRFYTAVNKLCRLFTRNFRSELVPFGLSSSFPMPPVAHSRSRQDLPQGSVTTQQ